MSAAISGRMNASPVPDIAALIRATVLSLSHFRPLRRLRRNRLRYRGGRQFDVAARLGKRRVGRDHLGTDRRHLHFAEPRADVRREAGIGGDGGELDRKSTRLNSSHLGISYAVFCLKKKR